MAVFLDKTTLKVLRLFSSRVIRGSGQVGSGSWGNEWVGSGWVTISCGRVGSGPNIWTARATLETCE